LQFKDLILFLIVITLLQSSSFAEGLRAFPSAEGAGAYTTHGRGGEIIEVTTLRDSRRRGSLRYATERARGPRIVVFRVGGEIKLKEPLIIKNPNIMIAGQSAPGSGITITGHQLVIATSDVVLRHLRIRPDGYVSGVKNEIDGIEIWPGWPNNPYISKEIYNIIIDHCSVSWASDENISINGNVKDTTIQWSIISEGLHQIPGTGRGMLLSPKAKNISIHHNLFANNAQRNILSKGASSFDFRNNIIYNWKFAGTQFERGWWPYENEITIANLVGNFYKRGPDFANPEARISYDLPKDSKIYVDDNDGKEVPTEDWKLITLNGSFEKTAPLNYKSTSQFDFPWISTLKGASTFKEVLSEVGATLPYIDEIDQRILNETSSGTGSVPSNNINDRGGYPNYKTTYVSRRYDIDRDGISTEYEIQKGFNPFNHLDGNRDADGDGYTNVEEFLNNTDPYIKN
jgi:pectate lyase